MNEQKIKWYYKLVGEEGLMAELTSDQIEDGWIFSRDVSGKRPGTKMYTYVDHPNKMLTYQSELPENERCFYETIHGNRIQKMKYDIDIAYGEDLPDSMMKSYSRDLIEKLITQTCKIIPYSQPQDFTIYTSSVDGVKESFHLVLMKPMVRNCKAAEYVYTNVMKARNDVDKRIFSKNDLKYVDSSVYKRSQQFRILGSSKLSKIDKGKPNYKRLLDRDFEPIDFFKSLITTVITDAHLFDPIQPIQTHFPLPQKMANVCYDSDKIDKIIEEMLPGLRRGSEKEGGTLISLTHSNPYNCIVCNRQHENENPYLIVVGSQQAVRYVCRRSNKTELLVKLKPEAEPDIIPTNYNAMICLPNYDPEHVYDERWVRDIHPKIGETILINSYLGTGKTVAIKRFLTRQIDNNPDLKVCVLSPRQAFARNITVSLNTATPELNIVGMGFKCYLDVDKDKLSECKRIVIQMESLYKLKTDDYPVYDVVICDELESLLYQFSSSTMNPRKGVPIRSLNVEAFEVIIRGAGIVVGADAFLQERSEYVMKQLRSKIIIQNNKRKPSQRKAIHCVGRQRKCKVKKFLNGELTLVDGTKREGMKGDFITRIQKALLAGKKIVIVSASKGMLDKLIDQIKGIKVQKMVTGPVGTFIENIPITFQSYSSSSSDAEKALYGIDHLWSTLDCLMYTTCITVGVDYNREHFDELFIYGSNYKNSSGERPSCVPRDLFQASMRVRNLRDNKMTFCVHGQQNAPPGIKIVTLDDIKNEFEEKEKIITSHAKQCGIIAIDGMQFFDGKQLDSNYDLNKEIDIVVDNGGPPKWYWGLRAYNEREKRIADTHYMEMFEAYTTHFCGYIVEKSCEYVPIPKITPDLTEATPTVSADEFKSLMDRVSSSSATTMDKKIVDKYLFMKACAIDSDDPRCDSLLKLWGNSSGKQLFTNMKMEKVLNTNGPQNAINEIKSVLKGELANNHKIDCQMYYNRLSIILNLNNLLGYPHDQDEFEVPYDKLEALAPSVVQMKEQLAITFGFQCPSFKEPITGAAKIIGKIYGVWRGSDFKRLYKVKKIQGRTYNMGGLSLKNPHYYLYHHVKI